MVTLNKNQTKFFEEALNSFGKESTNVKYKDLVEFAEQKELIIPISALKAYCGKDTRGYYDLTLVGINMDNYKQIDIDVDYVLDNTEEFEVYNEDVHELPIPKEKSNIIIDSSSFASESDIDIDTTPQRKKYVFVVMNTNEDPIKINETLVGAFKNRIAILHDQGNKKIGEVESDIKKKGFSTIKSANSNVYCHISKMELDE